MYIINKFKEISFADLNEAIEITNSEQFRLLSDKKREKNILCRSSSSAMILDVKIFSFAFKRFYSSRALENAKRGVIFFIPDFHKLVPR